MRDFSRIALRICMVLILFGGCVHNIYHFKILADRQITYHYNYPNRYNTNYVYEDTTEIIEEINEVVITPENDDDIEYSEYRDRIRTSSYR